MCGTLIYSNDMALDVKEDIKNLLSVGKSTDEIISYVMSYLPDEGDEEECAFWTAFADTLWNYGLLAPSVKSKVEVIIRNGGDTALFQNETDRVQRKAVKAEKAFCLSVPLSSG